MTGPDFTTDFGQRALQRLASERVLWLTTVTAKGVPQPSPVWFLWHDDSVLIYSQPHAPKVRAIQQNPQVALSFNSTFTGGDVVIFRGTAELVLPSPLPSTHDAFMEKYRPSMQGPEVTEASFDAEYTQLILISLTGLRGF
jgi:PPOX class probable F420-dependent enzyme